MPPVCVSRFNLCISWSIFTNLDTSLMSFGVPRALFRVSPLSIIPTMLHTNLQHMVLLPKGINARNFGTFHKPKLCEKSVARYIKYFQLVRSQSYGSCMRDTFCASEALHSWLARAYTVVCLSQTRYVCTFSSSDLHIRMLYAMSRPWLRWLCGLLC
jgi:hypothetical protein